MAAGRAYQVEEFLQRKREAMLNKVRAEGQLVRTDAYKDMLRAHAERNRSHLRDI